MKSFLKTEWRNLCIANYEVDRRILSPYIPRGTELDLHKGKAIVSLVGFEFLNTSIMGIPMPFHRKFIELNLRFYVKGYDAQHIFPRSHTGFERHGVVFIKEVVPKYLASMTARTLYNEPFVTRPMCHYAAANGAGYSIHDEDRWKDLIVYTGPKDFVGIKPGGMGDFIINRDFGFCSNRSGSTSFYQVKHDKWRAKRGEAEIRGGLERFYGPEFYPYLREPPISSYVVEGSQVSVSYRHRLLQS